jgi:hypothetical protein
MSYRYKAFGLIFESDIELPEFEPVLGFSTPSVFVKIGKSNPDILYTVHFADVSYVKSDHYFKMMIEDVGTFEVRDGAYIIIEPVQDRDIESARIYIYGTCASVILMQRQILCLHGSGVLIDNQAVLFLGESGMGKSTTARYFAQNGYKFIGDDTLPILTGDDGNIKIQSSFPQYKLWQESLDLLDEDDSASLTRIQKKINKYSMIKPDDFLEGQFPIHTCFVLDWGKDVAHPIVQLNTVESFAYFKQNIYRQHLLVSKAEQRLYFNVISNLAQSVTLYRIQGTRSFAFLDTIKQWLTQQSKPTFNPQLDTHAQAL